MVNQNAELKSYFYDKKLDKLKISWTIELKDDGYRSTQEAEDILTFSDASSELKVQHKDISQEGVKGRDYLTYKISNETIKIYGDVDVLDREIVRLDIHAPLINGMATTVFGADDKLILRRHVLP